MQFFQKLNHVHIWFDGSSTCVSFLKVCVAWWYSYNWLPPVRVPADVDGFDTHIFSEGIGEVLFCSTLNHHLLWSSELMTLNTSVGFSRWRFPWLPLAWWLGLTWIPRYQLFLPSSWRESSNQSLRQSKRVVCPKAGENDLLVPMYNVWDDCDWDFPGCFSRISSWSAWGEHEQIICCKGRKRHVF